MTDKLTLVDWDRYSVSEDGDVIDLKSRMGSSYRIKFFTDAKGYLGLNLMCVDGKRRAFLFHRVLAEKFIPNPQGLPQINHINGIRNDNRLSNLEWCDNRHNVNHAYQTGLAKTKLTEDDVLDMRWLHSLGVSMRKMAIEWGVCHASVKKAVTGETWSHV